MFIKSVISHFCKSEEGAVTVDFVVLTAAIVGLGVAATAVVSGGVSDLSTDVDGQLNAQVIQTSFAPSISFASIFPIASAWSAAPSCSLVGDVVTCSGGGGGERRTYNMSDGTQWTYERAWTGSGEETITWRDENNEIVAANDVPDLPDDLPMQELW